jgi:FdhD protein
VRRGSTVRRAVERIALAEGAVRRGTRDDLLAAEEPLEIRLQEAGGEAHRVAVTMRTPGADFELAAGFLFGEGLVSSGREIAALRYCTDAPQQYNVVSVALAPGVRFDPALLARNFYTTSSCGVCGKASIEAAMGPACGRVEGDVALDPAVLVALPETLRSAQRIFARTGGLHGAGQFTAAGELVRVREDVGRHNALDKVVGAALLAGELPLARSVVLVSGRLSFELVQKAARAGVPVLAGVSAPSSLAVELAERCGMTLAGFVRGPGFNVYTGGARIRPPSQGDDA